MKPISMFHPMAQNTSCWRANPPAAIMRLIMLFCTTLLHRDLKSRPAHNRTVTTWDHCFPSERTKQLWWLTETQCEITACWMYFLFSTGSFDMEKKAPVMLKVRQWILHEILTCPLGCMPTSLISLENGIYFVTECRQSKLHISWQIGRGKQNMNIHIFPPNNAQHLELEKCHRNR